MAALFNSSANNIDTAALPGPYAGLTGTPSVGTADGPQGINTLHCNGGMTPGILFLPNIAITGSNGLVVGAGFSVPTFNSGVEILYSIGGTIGSSVLLVGINPDGSMFCEITSGTVFTSASGTFTFGNRHEVEILVTEFNGSGHVTIYLDGVAVANLTSVQPANGSSQILGLADGSTIHTVGCGGFLGQTQSQSLVMDSTYAFDTSGSFCNAPVGPAISVIMIPNATGQNSAWTPNGAANGWQCINDIPPDGDTTYISDNTPNDEESVNLTPPSGITGVYAVSVIADQRQDTAGGGRTIQLGLGDGSTRSYGTAWGLGTTYRMNTTSFSSNPFTSSAWVLADMAALQSAVKLAS